MNLELKLINTLKKVAEDLTLSEYLKQNTITQSSLAARTGITQPYLSLMLAGKCEPKLETLNRICGALGGEVRMEELLREFKPNIYRAIIKLKGGKK